MEKIISAPAKIQIDPEGFKQQMKERLSEAGAPKEKFITADIMPREIMYNIPDVKIADVQIPEESS